MSTIVKSKLIQGEHIKAAIENGALHLLDTARGVLVPFSVLESMTLKDIVDEVTEGQQPLTEPNTPNSIVNNISAVEPKIEQVNKVPYGAPQENINMEEAPVNLTNESIVPPNMEEINKLRAVIADATNKLSKLQDQLDELNQMLQYTLDNSKEESRGMKM